MDAYGAFQPCMLLRHPEATYDLAAGSDADAAEEADLLLERVGRIADAEPLGQLTQDLHRPGNDSPHHLFPAGKISLDLLRISWVLKDQFIDGFLEGLACIHLGIPGWRANLP